MSDYWIRICVTTCFLHKFNNGTHSWVNMTEYIYTAAWWNCKIELHCPGFRQRRRTFPVFGDTMTRLLWVNLLKSFPFSHVCCAAACASLTNCTTWFGFIFPCDRSYLPCIVLSDSSFIFDDFVVVILEAFDRDCRDRCDDIVRKEVFRIWIFSLMKACCPFYASLLMTG